jgi:hypothetical protein
MNYFLRDFLFLYDEKNNTGNYGFQTERRNEARWRAVAECIGKWFLVLLMDYNPNPGN